MQQLFDALCQTETIFVIASQNVAIQILRAQMNMDTADLDRQRGEQLLQLGKILLNNAKLTGTADAVIHREGGMDTDTDIGCYTAFLRQRTDAGYLAQ